jgi:hypothetical protein
MTADQLINSLDTLPVAEFQRVAARVLELDAHYRSYDAPAQTPETRQEALQGRRGVSYRQELAKCGKAACKRCAAGQGHGPYWRAYWFEGGKTRSKYIGKHLPEHVQKAQPEQATTQPSAIQLERVTDAPVSVPVAEVEQLPDVEIVRWRGGRWHLAGGLKGNHYTICGQRIPEDERAVYSPYTEPRQVTCGRCRAHT